MDLESCSCKLTFTELRQVYGEMKNYLRSEMKYSTCNIFYYPDNRCIRFNYIIIYVYACQFQNLQPTIAYTECLTREWQNIETCFKAIK